jgi:hypothetical protein
MKTMSLWSEQEDKKLRDLCAEGLSPHQMVEHLPGRSRQAIIGRLNRIGLRTRESYLLNKANEVNETHELIIKLRCKPWNWPAVSIAQALGVNHQVVHNVIHLNTEAPCP